jgi:hypothetical protein
MRYYFSLLLLFLFTGAYAQAEEFTKPDYKLIEKNVTDKNSPLYFDRLFERYNRADSTMTTEEKRHLYYGYSYQEEYSPYETPEAQEDLDKLLQKEDTDKKTLEKLLKITAKVLKEYPFSIRVKEYRIYCFKELDMPVEAEKETAQVAMIIDAIVSTGDGTTPEKCFYVINTGNEYEILDILGFDFGGKQELVEYKYDYLTLAENAYNIEGLYFEISRLFETFKL